MKNLIEIAKKLEEKQTWIIKNFENFLEYWRNDTDKIELENKMIEIYRVADSDANCENIYIYYLELGSTLIIKKTYNTEYDHFQCEESYFAENFSTTRLKSFIKNIPAAIQNWLEKTEKEIKDFEQYEEFFNKFN